MLNDREQESDDREQESDDRIRDRGDRIRDRQNDSPPTQRTDWLNGLEGLSVVGAIGGTVAAAVLRQFLFAAVPLSVVVGLNWLNRRRLVEMLRRENQGAIATLATDLQQDNARNRTELHQAMGEQNSELQSLIAALGKESKTNLQSVQNFVLGLKQQHQALANVVDRLRTIEDRTQAIRIDAQDADAYYQRGKARYTLGNLQGALEDYNAAIRYDPKHAEALKNRSAIYRKLGDAKEAIEDARKAAKLFFDLEDMVSYQQIVEETRTLYDLNLESDAGSTEPIEEAVTVGNLFID